MIKAVIFDVDGVLIDSFEANLRFFENLMVKAGYPKPKREEFHELFHLSMMDTIKALTKLNSEEELRKIWNMGKSREVNYPVDLLATPEGMEKTILDLNKNYTLGIVSNRVKESVYEAPRLAKLKDHFKSTITYEDTINHKPNPEPLLLAASELDIEPRSIVYVGDAENDLIAGKAAGMKVIAYSPNKYKNTDAQALLFTDLPAIIRTL
ncbi:MAG TPA: HAD family hydrolase [Patescibacteria group bacterium]|nr:HAD family hydrolase [Patescibacteria group bacterium]